MSKDEGYANLGEVANESVDQTGPVKGDHFVYVDIGSIDRERKTVEAPQTVPVDSAPSRAKQRLSTGDVLVSMTRPNLNAVAIVPAHLDGAIGSTGFHVLRSKHMVSKYLYFLVQSQEFVDAMCAVVQGALYPAVRPGDINAFAMRVPTHSEQTRIVDKLEELLSDLDAGVAELKAAQKKLAQYRQSLLKAAVEGRLTEAWRAKHGEPEESGAQLLERILRERRARWEAKQLAKFEARRKAPAKGWRDNYPEPVAPALKGLPKLPQSWVWASLDQVVYDLRSGTAETSGRQPTDYPVLKSSAVRPGRIDFQALNYLQQDQSDRVDNFLELGDLLITRLSGSVEYVGCCALVKQIPILGVQFPDRIFRGKVSPLFGSLGDFLVCCFRSGYVRTLLEAAAKSTAGHKRISLSDLHGLPIPMPPAAEIAEAVQQFHEMLERADRSDEAIEVAARQSAAQRKNILQAAFSGQLVPQDPNDETASVLLERIRADRAAPSATKARRGRRTANVS
ncbi:restriction endonuclease [Xylophilus sp. Leaf220]|uniref:restriction endonuclease n=1 Tax=Xylophilus sp. Leaf220 TaxID=1735686 RepID=UPI000A90CE96|nr:restriction endonuclease [Xylophilus sp. Leaf220]